MSDRISQQQLESYLWGAAVLLRGTIDAGDYKQFIFPLLFYKRLCDVYDEETQIALSEYGGDETVAAYPENHTFQIPPDAEWKKVRQAAKNVGQALQSSMRAIETANPDKLYGIFGDAQWTNKDRLSDAMLRDLIEHFSTLELTLANLPEDELGQGYEYLIKKFADDSGHTAAEFYTNRTVVHLMTEILQPQPGESIYDPTCGSGGMLLSCVTHLRRQGQEWRNVQLFGQERNLMTSSIARMNCFLHGIEHFQIVRGDTLSEPKLVEGDRLKQFDMVLANPPYSIKQWDRDAFASDPWGRNLFGTPPQGRADYAFWQHILLSLKPKTGRCAILFPHGVLFRQEEAEMRRKLIETDSIECVIGLGPNLFYNAAMEACVIVCRTAKSRSRKGKILFINAVNEVVRERTQSLLTDDHIKHIVGAYESFGDKPAFARVALLDEVRQNDHSLKIDLYVSTPSANNGNGAGSEKPIDLPAGVAAWSDRRVQLWDALASLVPELRSVGGPSDRLKVAAQQEMLRHFDGSSWRHTRFGDVVTFVKESVDPSSGELNRYIAGDHMETDDVHLRRWGLVGDGYLGPAFIRRFRKGQALYGSRRTYLKKVAYADFDGITANTTFVLEAVKERLHSPLLPWIMLSQKFTEHSVRESKGSTNPYINFPDIAKFEFNLPPLDQQQRIADLLWAVDRTENEYIALEQSILELAQAQTTEQFPALDRRDVQFAPLGDVCLQQPQSGLYKGPQFIGKGVKTVNMGELFGNDVIDRNVYMQRTMLSPEEIDRYRLRAGDLLFGRRSIVLAGAGKCSIVGDLDEDTSFESSILRITLDTTKVAPGFLFAWFACAAGSDEIKRIRSFTTVAGITGSALKTVRVPLLPLSRQAEIFDHFQKHRAQIAIAQETRDAMRRLRGELLELLVGARA